MRDGREGREGRDRLPYNRLVTDWTTISSLATAGGTLVLGIATFAAVRSANRSARIAERSFNLGLRPILATSRLEDAPQRVMFGDRHWVDLLGGRAVVEVLDGIVYLAMLVRNVGNGMAFLEAWDPIPGLKTEDVWDSTDVFRPQTRSLWIAPGDVAFWQGALRDPAEPLHQSISSAVTAGELTIDLLHLDHEGGHRSISRFLLIRQDDEGARGGVDGRADGGGGGAPDARGGGGDWWVTLARHHAVDDG